MSEAGYWYLVQCKAQESFRAQWNLENQGFECFHPTHRVKKKSFGVLKTVEAPLFPFYLFVYLATLENFSKIRSTRGVRQVVRFNGAPATVDPQIIQDLKYHCDKLNGLAPAPMFKKGEKVLINNGPFKDIEAVVTANKEEDRVLLLLSMLNKEHELEFSASDVRTV